jgi:hypothetical protein
MPQPIKVSFNGSKVECKPDEGNAWVRQGDITWALGNNIVKFKLDFYKENMQGNGASSDWPFSHPDPSPPSSSSTGWTTGFTGTVREEPGAYKYVVEVERITVSGQSESYFLDPMIIVGRG